MKHWLEANFFSGESTVDGAPSLGKKEFYIEMSLVAATLALFGLFVHAFGA
jgi:hypothetical protein